MGIAQITNLNQYVNMTVKKNSLNHTFPNKNQYSNSNNMKKMVKDTYMPSFMKPDNDEQKAKRLATISNKMMSGKELSSSDMEYLRKHAPEWYEKAKRIQQQREEYRRALENCKTKDEAQLLHSQKMLQLAGQVKSAKSNNAEAEVPFLMMEMTAMSNEFNEFIESESYAKKPNQYELVAEMIEKQKDRNNDYENDNDENEDSEDSYFEFDIEFGNGHDEATRDIEIKEPNSPHYSSSSSDSNSKETFEFKKNVA